MMDLNGECKGGGGDGFIDRSRVRILLCDNDSNSLGDVFTLLSQCSYQVTSVKSARQVIDALNAEGPDIDIILAEIDLPMAKGMKMLRYITRDKDLRRIPVIMMSRKDEVHVVVKCLKLGAADYLVKPLRTNELLNLWTHMWRRRRMLGLAEKNMLSYDFDLAGSDPSDPNTNSNNLFSDDTDERSIRSTNPHRGHQEKECPVAMGSICAGDGTATSAPPAVAMIEPPLNTNPVPKKSRLKIGESSAFFTYVKSAVLATNPPHVNGNGSLHPVVAEKLQVVASEVMINKTRQTRRGRVTEKSYPQGVNLQNGGAKELQGRSYQERNMNTAQVAMKRSKDSSQVAAAQNAYPYYMQGVMNQVMMQSAAAMMPQYNHQHPHYPPNHHLNGMTGVSYYHHYPMNTSLQHNQMSQNGQMSMVHYHPSSNEVRVNKLDRREEALLKFRRKRNQRCFDKKIRYVNRKKLAERRPRVKGQFVRKMNGVNVDLNGQPEPDSADYDDEDEEEEEEENRDSSPQDDAQGT